MKFLRLSIPFLLLSGYTFGQATHNNRADSLLSKASTFGKAGKYAEAISNYQQALTLEPNNEKALCQFGFLLHTAGKDAEAIPYLQKLTSCTSTYAVNGLNLLGSIYDNSKQTDKAIATYTAALKIDPKNRELYYNVALAYYKELKFAAAEDNLASALKIDPSNALTHRMYALAAFHQGKNAACILAFCNFLLLDPQSPQALEAYTNIERIFAGSAGVKATKPGVYAYDKYIVQAEAASKKATSDRIEAKFKTLFTLIGEAAQKQGSKDFFSTFYADYFHKLAQSPNMPSFSHTISLSVAKEANSKWLTEHQQEVDSLKKWMEENGH